MFGTSIHWTTFFYLLIDTAIVLYLLYVSFKKTHSSLKHFIYLGFSIIAYNITGGFLPIVNFPGPLIIQYIITYSVAIFLCLYIIYYLYKEYDIVVLKYNLTLKKVILITSFGFILLFLFPYFISGSLNLSRYLFTIPISIFAFVFLIIFYRNISKPSNSNTFILRRNKLSTLSLASIALLPVFTIIGDYQWITFTLMNTAFYAITIMEIDRYLFFIKNNTRMFEIFALKKKQRDDFVKQKIIYEDLTRREIEITLSILSELNYKNIAKELFIAESTVSKHASNIFKKTGVKNRSEFLKRFLNKQK
ncbi:helix-turn-helix transcriptional regulator [Polaribacter sejongensis]|uniref:Helix-turn-helix transcriptional regulator n=1 Tax=Polaribacter sejongensis TaxID=985043 RepID=A0ABN5FC45_9FLAO|nr:helix-turn-helix transcriptional regulator [Polaribacter sejongensis]AUC23862.1 helix-turn-helix transcriptional regulator [Polaribacter sejongensis]